MTCLYRGACVGDAGRRARRNGRRRRRVSMHVQGGSSFDGGRVGDGGVGTPRRYLRWSLDLSSRLNPGLRNGHAREVENGSLWAAWERRGSCYSGVVGAVAASCIVGRDDILTVVSGGRALSCLVMVSRDKIVEVGSLDDVAVAGGMLSRLEVACLRILEHCCVGTGMFVEVVADTVAALVVAADMDGCLQVLVHLVCPGSIPVLPSLRNLATDSEMCFHWVSSLKMGAK